MSEPLNSPRPERDEWTQIRHRTFVKCYRCKLIHVHGWAHHCPKAPDLTVESIPK